MANSAIERDDLLAVGNAIDDSQQGSQRGWFVGHFIPKDCGLRCTQEIEIKWGIHRPNEERDTYAANEQGTTLTLLVSGSFVVEFPELDVSINLKRPGDYVIFAPQVIHGWRVLEDSVVLTVRWPSIPFDQIIKQ